MKPWREMTYKEKNELMERDACARAWRVVETDNHDGDYPGESWESPVLRKATARKVADIYNAELCPSRTATRYYKVVHKHYDLAPAFEP
jgi:hypothetical protein